MKRILVLMLAVSVLFCNMLIVASAEADLIVFDSIESNGTVDIEDLADFTVSVDESITVSSVELIADGESLGKDTEAPYCFSLDDSTLGERYVEAIVCDSSDVYHYAEKTFTVVEYTKSTVYSEHFDSYAGTNGSLSNGHWHDGNGTQRVFDRGDENGKSMMFSYPDVDHSETGHNCRDSCDKWPALRHTGGLSSAMNSTIVHLETDFYIDQSEKGKGRGWSTYSWGAYGSSVAGGNKTNSILKVSVSADGAVLNCAGETYSLTQKQWHRIAFEYDWKTGITTFWLDDDEKFKNKVQTPANALNGLTRLQLTGNLYGGCVAFDNFDMWIVNSSPYGTGLTGEEEILAYTQESVTLDLTQGISSVEPTLFKLSNEIGEVKIESAEVSLDDKTITVTPVEGFLSSNTYELIIPAETVFSGGKLTKPLKLRFKTSQKEIDVVSGNIKRGAGVCFSADVVNTSGTPKTLTAYICAYKNGVFYKLEKAVASVNGTSPVPITTPTIEKGSDFTYKAFVVDENGAPITDKFYNLELN